VRLCNLIDGGLQLHTIVQQSVVRLRQMHNMQYAACAADDPVVWSVSLSVCLSRSCATQKRSELIEVLFIVETLPKAVKAHCSLVRCWS